MISQTWLLSTAVAAFLCGILYNKVTTSSTRSEHQRTKKELALTLANRDALKQVSQSYRTNLKTFEEIRFEVEVGLRARIDTLKDQLDAIEESLSKVEASEDSDDEWLLENVKNVPITLRPELAIESEEDSSRVILSFQDELYMLASHSIINDLSSEVFIQAIEDILSSHELIRKSVLHTIFCAILSKTHPTDHDAIVVFWDHNRMVFNFFIEDQECLAVFVCALQSTIHSDDLVHLHYELLFNDPDMHHSVSSRSSLLSHQPSEIQCREKLKQKLRRVSFHPDTRKEVLPLDKQIELELYNEHALIIASFDSESDIDESASIDTELYRINREISLSIVSQGRPSIAQCHTESILSDFTAFGTAFTETNWFEQRGEETTSDENVFNIAKESHAKRRSLKKKKRC